MPVLYQYTDRDGEGAVWKEVYGPNLHSPGAEKPGFVGAIAWIGPDRALAVGGDGVYPRREPAAGTPDTSGNARAWLYSGGHWEELPAPPDAGGAPRALTAVDCSHDAAEEFCVAGGLRQLWTWRSGQFDKGYSDQSPQTDVDHPALFQFRVRQVRVPVGPPDPREQADAITSGCCAPNPAQNAPRVLILSHDQLSVRLLFNDPSYAIDRQTGSSQAGDIARTHPPPRRGPDSYYSFTARPVSVLATPGGPVSDVPEPPSEIDGPYHDSLATESTFNSEQLGSIPYARPDFTSNTQPTPGTDARLVSGDGDGTDGIEWAVGALRSSGQGVAFTTLPQTPNRLPTTCSIGDIEGLDTSKCAQPRPPADTLKAQGSVSLFRVSSYALNSFTMIGQTGVSWAVGDRGAILRLGGEGSVGGGSGAGPGVPQVGPHDQASGSDTTPYGSYRPLGPAARPGEVPLLAARPVDLLATPQFVPSGGGLVPGSLLPTVVMSRDGSEGWAMGMGQISGQVTVDHFDGTRWVPCNLGGTAGQVAPNLDPGCASLAALTNTEGFPGKLVAAARVPLEHGDDSSKANNFEVEALGTSSSSGYSMLRYRDGLWSIDESATKDLGGAAMPPSDIAFTAPDDGWITGGFGNRAIGKTAALYHLGSSHHWIDCGAAAQSGGSDTCDDPHGRLPFNSVEPQGANARGLRLTVAGDRVYMFGTRVGTDANGVTTSRVYPLIIYHQRASGEGWTDANGGYDPLFDNPAASASDQGRVFSLSIAQRADATYEGWAVGQFGGAAQGGTAAIGGVDQGSIAGVASVLRARQFPSALLHLKPDGSHEGWQAKDASDDYLFTSGGPADPRQQLTLPNGQGGVSAFIAPAQGPLLSFDTGRQRWRAVGTAFQSLSYDDLSGRNTQGDILALAPDGHGGFWAPVARRSGGEAVFYHYTRSVPRPVFEDIAHPIRERITGMAGAADGSVWVTTNSSSLYRYDRLTGWEQFRVPGWDPGRVVTRSSPANAVAVGPNGQGIVVGTGGRIADMGPAGVQLDPVAGVACTTATPPASGCGTGYDLDAAAVAPDGSAIAGGAARTLLWRPPGGAFRPILTPPMSVRATILAISLPNPDRAWLATDTGDIWAGEQLAPGDWHWRLDDRDLRDRNETRGLKAMALDANGGGYAVGNEGLILQRAATTQTWKRLTTDFAGNYTSVTLPAGGQGDGALVGGDPGLILTLTHGQFTVAQPADPYNAIYNTAAGVHAPMFVAMLPGVKAGQVEAWAATQSSVNAVLHYTSDPSEPLLDGGAGRASSLPDTADPRPGETSFAAFGKSDCARSGTVLPCAEITGTNFLNETIARRVADEIVSQAGRPGGPQYAVSTGDANDAAGSGRGALVPSADTDFVHHRWNELVAQRIQDGGLPLFGATGGQDLAKTEHCNTPTPGTCQGTRSSGHGGLGSNLGWREAFADMPAPWGAPKLSDGSDNKPPPPSHGLSFVAVPATGTEGTSASTCPPACGTPDVNVAGQADVSPESVPAQTVSTAGAHTHYAIDIKRGARNAVRLVFVDTSLKTLAGSDATQNPIESQLAWLRSVLCIKGQEQTPADSCSREGTEQAIIVSETPTYSYGPGATTDTLTDGTTLEALLSQYHANLVVSGRLGWNALYWTTAPGLHTPCAGEDQPDPTKVPDANTKPCTQTTSTVPGANDAAGQAQALAGSLQSTAAPAAPGDCSGAGPNPTGVIPNAIAASAGGKFGPDGQASGTASQGFWHGYTIVRLDKSGDPKCTIVEQRPVFDWVGIQAVEHTFRPGQHVTLRGYGREPIGFNQSIQYDDINSPAITHRYDLVQADPQKPYLPKEDETLKTPENPNGYALLDPGVATIDDQTGLINTGKGSHPRVYAIGILSVGDKAASYPLVFEPRRSFRPAAVRASVLPVLPVRVLGAGPAALPPPPPAPPNPVPPNFTFPNAPAVPNLPPLSAPTARPPTPPVPPPPPANAAASALSIAPAAVGLNVAPPATVIPPPAPPINPAPPGGARREARQRQAAAAKSEEGAGGEEQQAKIDSASSPDTTPGSAMTRRDRVKPSPSITPLAQRDQPSAWARGAIYGGGLALMALTLALGFNTLRSGPRRRHPETPAPAFNRYRRR